MDNRKFIFVTGFFGAPLDEIAGRLAEDEGAELISLDEEISRDDGRSVLRIASCFPLPPGPAPVSILSYSAIVG